MPTLTPASVVIVNYAGLDIPSVTRGPGIPPPWYAALPEGVAPESCDAVLDDGGQLSGPDGLAVARVDVEDGQPVVYVLNESGVDLVGVDVRVYVR